MLRTFLRKCQDKKELVHSQLFNAYRNICRPSQNARIDTSPARRTREEGREGHADGGAAAADGRVSRGLPSTAKGHASVPAPLDSMAPNSSDPVLQHPAERTRHSLSAQRSVPPRRLSPGPQSQEPGSSLLMKMFRMVEALTDQLQGLKSQVKGLQLKCDPFPLGSVIPFVTNDKDNEITPNTAG